MKISNYSGTADTFTFPHNSRVMGDQLQKFVDQRDYNYSYSFFGMTNGIKSRRAININGHFDDSGTGDKEQNIKDLMKHCNENKIKKFYFSSDKFYIVIPLGASVSHNPGRTMFRDYVASFISPFGILFSDTQKNGAYNDSDENEGNVFTPIEKITTTSVSSGNTYTYKDADGNGFSLTASASGTLNIYMIYLEDIGAGAKFTNYLYAEIGGTKQVLSLATAGKTMDLGMESGEKLSDVFTGGSSSIPANTTLYFRDGYSAE